MAADYPGAVKSFSAKTNFVDTILAIDVNELQEEIAAIETELGINPPDVDDTVDAVSGAANLALRLDHIVNQVKAITGKAAWYTDPVTTIEQLETDVNAVEAAHVAKTLINAKGEILAGLSDNAIDNLDAASKDFSQLYSLDGASVGIAWGLRKYVQMTVVEYTTSCTIADGQAYLHVPAHLAGLDLVEVHAENITAGTTGTMTIQVRNVTDAVNMLSVAITIDTGETGSDTAATAPTIDTDNDDVAENDLIAIDIDGIHTTPAAGLIVTLGFA